MFGRKKTLALISIGQSPRTDDIAAVLSEQFDVTEYGLLDGCTLEDAEARFGPVGGEPILRPRMRTGRPAVIAQRYIDDMMRDAVRIADEAHSDLIVPFCISAFPDYESRALFVKPFDVCRSFLYAVAKGSRVGIVMPDKRMELTLPEEFPALDFRPFSVSPHMPDKQMEEELRGMDFRGIDQFFLNCASFDRADKAVFRRVADKPVVLARSVLEKALFELA